jgi:hypothetical protein
MTDFNDTDSETDVWDPSKDYLERNRLMQNLLKHQEEKNRITDCEKMKARSNALELEIKRINESLSDTTCAIEKKLIIGEVKRSRLEVERMVICGEYNETLFDAGIIPGDVAKYINRTSFVRAVPHYAFWRVRSKRIRSTGTTSYVSSNCRCHTYAFYRDRSIPVADRPQHVAVWQEPTRREV